MPPRSARNSCARERSARSAGCRAGGGDAAEAAASITSSVRSAMAGASAISHCFRLLRGDASVCAWPKFRATEEAGSLRRPGRHTNSSDGGVHFEIDKKLGITGREDVPQDGHRQVQRGVPIDRDALLEGVGADGEARRLRWIDFDFENDYKTMNLSFMESVWWVFFGQLHAKGLVYRGFKVMPYSCACNTPLSNFEVQQNYKEVTTRRSCAPSRSRTSRRPSSSRGRRRRGRCRPTSRSASTPRRSTSRSRTRRRATSTS